MAKIKEELPVVLVDEVVDSAQFGVQLEADVGHSRRIRSLPAQHILPLDALRRHVQIQVTHLLHNFCKLMKEIK